MGKTFVAGWYGPSSVKGRSDVLIEHRSGDGKGTERALLERLSHVLIPVEPVWIGFTCGRLRASMMCDSYKGEKSWA